MKNLLDERRNKINKFQELIKKNPIETKPVDIPDGVFMQCVSCSSAVYKKDLDNNFHVCPHCGFHFRIGAYLRILYTLDKNTFMEIDS
ncbi:MAG: acetyl-CoA carboxylase carboxyl transferase subunit beta, partial [Acholeplasmataceae bacterium]